MKFELYSGNPTGVYNPETLKDLLSKKNGVEAIVVGHVEGDQVTNIFYFTQFSAMLKQTTELVPNGEENCLGKTVLEEFSEYHSPCMSWGGKTRLDGFLKSLQREKLADSIFDALKERRI